jgi:hypothetical protein
MNAKVRVNLKSKMEEIEHEISGLRHDLELYQSKVRRMLVSAIQEENI